MHRNSLASYFLFSIFTILFIFTIQKIYAQENFTTQAKVNTQTNAAYTGPIYNIFFHPLIAYPKLAFAHKDKHFNYINDWFVTVNEFNKIMPALYQHGFILVSPQDVFAENTDAHGELTITRKKIILPQGKKPLILSLDDYNFYTTMKSHGTIHRFWVDKEDRLLTITHLPNGQTETRDDQEVPQLLEKFIANHPDFAFNHARGIIGLTGYNGIFGYDTQKLSRKDYQTQVNEAKRVVTKLKQMGWEFGSHSYFHLAENKQSEKNFEQSEKRWQKEVGAIVGPTSYYIFPFGDKWNNNLTRMHFLKSIGYHYFFTVAQANLTIIKPGAVIMNRFPMDGLAVSGKYRRINVFLDPTLIAQLKKVREININ